MKPGALLVNVGRGKLVAEADLVDALQRGAIAGAALDVVEHEPLDPQSPLWRLPNVILTPHTAGFRGDYWDVVTDLFAENLGRFDRGEPLLNVVDPEAGYHDRKAHGGSGPTEHRPGGQVRPAKTASAADP